MINPVYEVLDQYYMTQYADYDSPEYSESDLIYDHNVPLEKRESGILEKIEKLLAEGVDLNDAMDGDYPLENAVLNIDAPMVRYLIQHGADCRKYRFGYDDTEIKEISGYFEAINEIAEEESGTTTENPEKFKALCDIARILVKEGGLRGPFSGACFKITEDGEISFKPARPLF